MIALGAFDYGALEPFAATIAAFLGALAAMVARGPRWSAAIVALTQVAVVCSAILIADETDDVFARLVVGLAAVFGAAGLCAVLPALWDLRSEKAAAAAALALLLQAGHLAALSAQDFVTVFLGLELAGLAAAGLVALGLERDRRAAAAGFDVLIATTAGGALQLAGAAGVFAATGSFRLDVIATAEGAAHPGLAMVIVGVALKCGVAGLHGWTARALGAGPSLASPLLLLSFGVVGAATLMRIVAPLDAPFWAAALAGAAVIAILAASLEALAARNAFRFVVYALAVQFGLVLLALGVGGMAGFGAAVLGLAGAVAAGAVLLTSAQLQVGAGGGMAAFDGLGRRAPLIGAAATLAVVSLIGAPLTAGFLGKWMLIEALIAKGWWWGGGIVAAASLAAVVYGGRLIQRIWLMPTAHASAIAPGALALATPALLLGSIALIVIGVDANGPIGAARAAVAGLAPP